MDWIPITEQKPPGGEHCIVTLYWENDDWYQVCELDYGVDLVCGGKLAKRVIAWMPLPEPYKKEKHNATD